MIFIEKGDFYLGHRIIDDNGNLIQYRPKFKPNNNGDCVVVGMLDPKTREQVGESDVFTDFNAKGYLTKILELLSPEKNINIPKFKDIPDFKKIFASAYSNDKVNMCKYCDELHCDNCIVTDWKNEYKNNE